MSDPAPHVAALHKLFRSRPVALLSDLRKALHTPSRTTIFRRLRTVGYRTSYSHAGRYYTLARIPQFDPRGLWHYRQIGFSLHGTLRATVIHLVETSPAGQTHEELQDLLVVGVWERKQWKKGEGLPATTAATPTDPNPVVMRIVRLLAATSMPNDQIASTKRASPQDDFRAACRPIGFELVWRDGKWDKQNRTSSGLCPSGVDLPRSEPEAELLPPEQKNPTGREYSFSAMAF